MLLELRVKNLGIIEDMNWRLRNGLNVITGETGAGKSLVIDAIELLLAGKAGEAVIRYGADEAQIEGVFSLPRKGNSSPLGELLAQKDLLDDEETLVIACQFRRHRPGVIRVNGYAVPKTLLRQVGRRLVDIHGQSEHLSLLDSRSHLDFLDTYAHTLELRRSFSLKAAGLHRVEDELKTLESDEKERARREEFLRFQVEEISRAGLREGEEAELAGERDIIASAEKLKALAYEAYRALRGDDASPHPAPALDRLNEAGRALKKLVEIDASQRQQLDFLDETVYGLTEAARAIRAYDESLEYNPERLGEIESRLELIRRLKRKYGQTVAEILDYMARGKKELEGVQHSAERHAQLAQAVTDLKPELGQIAQQLSIERAGAAQRLMAEVKQELHDLNMAQVEFRVSISRRAAPEGIPLPGGESCAFSDEGIDTVEFMVATNPGESLKPLSRVASTGEISRFTLALKGALAEADSTPVLIFDEIDIGVGGRSGEIIGKKLCVLARDHQVVCVTHLPQIAAFADAHFSVHKEASGDRTVSVLEELDDESRVKELAVMLGGPKYTETSLNGARELVNKAGAWKKRHG
ncbi:MAG: DNA repair protein RecN [Chloroflexi bacterium]|nr:DNA repair protein RecN [Chloroflexota bacterium]